MGGVANRTLNSASDYYSSTVTAVGPNTYQIQATGHTMGANRTDLSQTLTMMVYIGTGQMQYNLNRAAVIGAGGTLPLRMNVDGDLHVDGDVTVMGDVTGQVSASGRIVDSVFGTIGSSSSYDSKVGMPSVNFDGYDRYFYNGKFYLAPVLSPTDATLIFRNNLLPTYSANPLGVVVVDGDLNLEADTKIKDGILVVRGDLFLNHNSLKLVGKSGYFSLLVQGDMKFDSSSLLDVSNAPIYLKGDLKTQPYASNAQLNAHGGMVANQMFGTSFNGQINVENTPLTDAASGDLTPANIRYFTNEVVTVIPKSYTSKVQ